ncbi:MAG: Aminopeptidase YwaD precursor [Bacteroidetes bacterium ADurb.Bin408]|nr:MAG: Aminopeptidase YwaD precursor [Bacteroidetes bacterium ADurb.Bin408]
MSRIINFLFTYILFGFLLYSCGAPEKPAKINDGEQPVNSLNTDIPIFNEDSAYFYIEKQVFFGPRVPNSKQHEACATYLVQNLKANADTVIVQKTRLRAYDGTALNISNIIASFNPSTNNRIFLCAHWDSRHIAEKDTNAAMQKLPINGANDGASGVGVLLEIARILKIYKPKIGVDIILFDAEDYGQSDNSGLERKEDTWALGSQYWAKNFHKKNYYARYGILLDMVGAANATFLKESYSMQYAPDVVRKVWQAAQRGGYGNYFQNKETNAITDDHYYINKLAGIPTIDIIHFDNTTPTGFFPFWHTHGDNMSVIDKETLKAVGQTLLIVIFEEK